MPLLCSSPFASAPRALRRGPAGAPSCRGGASSLLRVGQPSAAFAPAARAWASRLAVAAPRNPESTG